MKVNPIMDRPSIGVLQPKQTATQKLENPFSNILDSANDTQKEADTLLNALVSGKPVEPHDVMISLRKAEIEFQLVLQLRNNLLEAYQQIMKTQI